ncbi:hypothetical protein [Nonomuraea sp. KM88]|uniref:hypothetical protein n=1 Tax=Nonomuraea sp. KM88 TaxID=3457427 RepID=UPI003FCCA233
MGPSLDTVIDQSQAAAKAGFAGVWLGQRTGRDALTTLAVPREHPRVRERRRYGVLSRPRQLP